MNQIYLNIHQQIYPLFLVCLKEKEKKVGRTLNDRRQPIRKTTSTVEVTVSNEQKESTAVSSPRLSAFEDDSGIRKSFGDPGARYFYLFQGH